MSACVLEFLRPQKCVKLLDNTKLALGVSQNGCLSCNLSRVGTPPWPPILSAGGALREDGSMEGTPTEAANRLLAALIKQE